MPELDRVTRRGQIDASGIFPASLFHATEIVLLQILVLLSLADTLNYVSRLMVRRSFD